MRFHLTSETINIPEIFSDVHGFIGKTVNFISSVYTMSRSVVSSVKTRGAAECFRTTGIANFVNYLKNLTVYLSILTLIFSVQVILAKKIGCKI